jgi:hypothetical protein
MPGRSLLVAASCCLLVPAAGFAAPPPSAGLLTLDPAAARGLAQTLRGAVLQLLPNPLYDATTNWGHTRDVVVGLRWHGLRAEATRSPRNDGLWRKVRVIALNLPQSLVFDLRDVRQTPDQRLTFTVLLALDMHVDVEQQRWQAGVRLYSTRVEARLRAKLRLDCAVDVRLEAKGEGLPDAVFRLHVLRADANYDNLVVDHAAGVGGTTARLLGEAVRSGIRRFDPAVERGLLARADAAIVRAGENREVRVSLSKLLPGPVR